MATRARGSGKSTEGSDRLTVEKIWETRARFAEMRAAIDYLEAVHESKVRQIIEEHHRQLIALGAMFDGEPEDAPEHIQNFRPPNHHAERIQKLADELAKKAPKPSGEYYAPHP